MKITKKNITLTIFLCVMTVSAIPTEDESNKYLKMNSGNDKKKNDVELNFDDKKWQQQPRNGSR